MPTKPLEPKMLELETFLKEFSNNQRKSKKYCFVLGAGASRPSGIRTGAELVHEWMAEIDRKYSESEVKKWIKDKKIIRKNLSAYYSDIFDKCFDMDPQGGFNALEKEMDKKSPNIGYYFLARILAEHVHNVVITTNFDSLTEDALFIYTRKKPLVIGHESLAGYVNVNSERPVIVKIHRDLFFNPFNSNKETCKLQDNFEKALNDIFKTYTPIIIGYGGNDGSLMGYLDKLDNMAGRLFWFYRENDGLPNGKIRNLLIKKNGFLIPVPGFDEFMVQLANKLNLKYKDKELIKVAETRNQKFKDELKNIVGNNKINTETEKALIDFVADSWYSYELAAKKEKDINKKELIYQKGLQEFSDSAELYGNYAIFLKNIRKDYAKAEKYYKKSLELNPDNANHTGNYAKFLKNVRKDYDEAEKYYKKSLELNPDNANHTGNYAIFLSNIRKDYDEAEKYYKKSLELNPDDERFNGNYANFLSDIRKHYDEAEKYFKKSLELNSHNANTTGNYTKFNITRKEFDTAADLINKAFQLNKNERKDLDLELWFYRYAVFFKEYENAGEEVKKLLDDGVSSPGWYLDDVVKVAEELEHPDIEKVKEYAKRISAVE